MDDVERFAEVPEDVCPSSYKDNFYAICFYNVRSRL